MKVSYTVIRYDDCEDHVMSTTQTSLKDARRFVSFLRKGCDGLEADPKGTFLICKNVEEKRRPRRWRLG